MSDIEKSPCACKPVNRKLLPVKGIYFTFMAAVGDLLPFITIYMKQLGLSSTETGIIYGVMPFITFFMRPVFGAIADKTRKHKLLLMTCSLLTGICYCLLLVTPAKTSSYNELEDSISVRTQVQCNPLDSYVTDCHKIQDLNKTEISQVPLCQQSLTEFSKQFSENASEVPCKAICSIAIVPSDLSVCFTDDVSTSNTETCGQLWNNTGTSVDILEFTVIDITDVVRNQVMNNDNVYSGEICETYDLKNVSYNGPHRFWQFTCSGEAVFDCKLVCSENYHKTCITVKSTNLSKTFWIFFVIFMLGNIFFSPVISLVDAIAYDILGEKRGNWGQQRLWGTIGFAGFAIASTFIMDTISKTKTTIDFSVSFYIFLGLTTISTVVAYFLQFSESLHSSQMFKNLVSLLKYPKIVMFLLVITCFGIMNAVIEAFLFWYLNDLGSTQIVLGLCLVLNCVPEVIMFRFTGKIIQKIGHVNCLYLAALGYAVRFFCYSFLTQPWYVLLIEPVHSLTFALMYAAASSYASIITPEGMSGTIQGLIGGLYFGFGKGIGSLVTGKLFDPVSGLGEKWTFRFYGFFALFVLAVYVAMNCLCLRDSSVPRSKPQTDKQTPHLDGEMCAAEDQLLEDSCIQNENADL